MDFKLRLEKVIFFPYQNSFNWANGTSNLRYLFIFELIRYGGVPHKFFSFCFFFNEPFWSADHKKYIKTLEAHQLGINSLKKLLYAIFFPHFLSEHFLLALLPLSKWISKNIITIDEHKNNILFSFFLSIMMIQHHYHHRCNIATTCTPSTL